MPRITRSRSVAEVDGKDLEALNRELAAMLGKIQSFSERRKIVEPAGDMVKRTAQSIAPVSRREHYRYATPKLVANVRAPKGYGRRVAAYLPGNLRNAIVDIGERKKKYRTYRVIIGPLYRSFRSLLKSGRYGASEHTADGYYAHMVYGSARLFRDRVTGAALRFNQGAVVEIIRRGVINYFVREAKKTQYWTSGAR